MAKKNRSPRPSLDLVYLNKDEEIPGCGGTCAEKDGWVDAENHPDFTWAKYREWAQKREEEWQASHQTDPGGVIFPIP